MKRRLFTILSGLSLLLFVAVCVLWVRSYRRGDSADYVCGRIESGEYRGIWGDVSSLNGGVGLYLVRQSCDAADVRTYWPELTKNRVRFSGAREAEAATYPPVQAQATGQFMGFNYTRVYHRNPSPMQSGRAAYVSAWGCTAPHWSLALLTALPVAIRFLRARRKHQGHLCPSCGYDLRAALNRCPECGAVPAKARI